MRPAIAQRASTIAECTDISVFAPEINDDGVAQPEEWFGLDPAAGEDSAEEIASSDEGEDEKERKAKTLSRPVKRPASLSLIVPPATRRVLARPLREAVIMPRFASRPLLQPALPSPPTCPARQSLPQLNLQSLSFFLLVAF